MSLNLVKKRRYQAFRITADGLLRDVSTEAWSDRTWPQETEEEAAEDGFQRLAGPFIVVPVYSRGYE